MIHYYLQGDGHKTHCKLSIDNLEKEDSYVARPWPELVTCPQCRIRTLADIEDMKKIKAQKEEEERNTRYGFLATRRT